MPEARIDAHGHLDRPAGPCIVPGPGFAPVFGRRLRGFEAEAFGIAIGHLPDGAAAVSAAGRIAGLPGRMVAAQHGAVPAGVSGPGAGVGDGDAAQPRPHMGQAPDGLPAAPGPGHAQAGVEDDPEAPCRSGLNREGLAGERIGHHPPAPPSLSPQQRPEFPAEPPECPAPGACRVEGLADIHGDVDPRHPGNGEGAAMEGLRQGVRIHGAGDLREAGAEVLKAGRLFGGCRDRLDHRLHGRFPAVDGDGDGAVDRVAFGARPCRTGARPGPACLGVPVACPVRRARHVRRLRRLPGQLCPLPCTASLRLPVVRRRGACLSSPSLGSARPGRERTSGLLTLSGPVGTRLASAPAMTPMSGSFPRPVARRGKPRRPGSPLSGSTIGRAMTKAGTCDRNGPELRAGFPGHPARKRKDFCCAAFT